MKSRPIRILVKEGRWVRAVPPTILSRSGWTHYRCMGGNMWVCARPSEGDLEKALGLTNG